MALYDKKILYLDYLENGKKVKNAGFAKVEVRDGCCRILLNVKGTYETDSLRTEVLLLTDVGEIVTDHFMLTHGTGTYLAQLNPDNMADKGISYEECLGVGVRLSESRMVQATWRELLIPPEALITPEPKPESRPEPEPEAMREPEPEALPQMETEPEPMPDPVREPENLTEAPLGPESIQEPETVPERELHMIIGTEARPEAIEEPVAELRFPLETGSESIQEPEPLPELEPESAVRHSTRPKNSRPKTPIIYDDKWKQLCQMFETIYPFHDERGYLSITPRDFVVLTKEYQPMVNNSFLLHGFYNYKHIILGRDDSGREERFYIGVPGVYYDREKQVAVMFGFESFESETEPAENGSFGYYMKRVQI